jgi:hypothetical protein
MVLSLLAFAVIGLNFGIDFRGGTSIRTEAVEPVDVGAYRSALQPLELGDVAITEVFDPNFRADQNVAMIRIQAQEGEEAITPEVIAQVETALQEVDATLRFHLGGIGRPQGFGRADPGRGPGGDAGARGGAVLHLAAFRVAVQPRRGGRAGA